jgi:hypothetical protein
VAGTSQDCGWRRHLLVMQQREDDQRDGLVRVPVVKWDDGSSSSLRVGRDTFETVSQAQRSPVNRKWDLNALASIGSSSQAETFDHR